MAVSLEAGRGDGELHWETAAHVAGLVIPWAIDASDPLVLNVNAPNLAADEVRGLCRARLASFGAVQTNVAERGEGWVRITVSDLDGEDEPGTDAALIADGYATVTPLQPICEAVDVDLPVPRSAAAGDRR